MRNRVPVHDEVWPADDHLAGSRRSRCSAVCCDAMLAAASSVSGADRAPASSCGRSGCLDELTRCPSQDFGIGQTDGEPAGPARRPARGQSPTHRSWSPEGSRRQARPAVGPCSTEGGRRPRCRARLRGRWPALIAAATFDGGPTVHLSQPYDGSDPASQPARGYRRTTGSRVRSQRRDNDRRSTQWPGA